MLYVWTTTGFVQQHWHGNLKENATVCRTAIFIHLMYITRIVSLLGTILVILYEPKVE